MDLFQVDAFTNEPFRGNPAAVCLLDAFPSDDWMQSFAAEMKHSETAFLCRKDDLFALRWFTPGAEVDLCGHATLAAAHILWSEGLTTGSTTRFETRSGILTATKTDGRIELNFPGTPPEPASPPTGLFAALGTTADYIGLSRFDYVVEVASEDIVRSLNPDLRALAMVEARGVMVTSRAANATEYDFVSRFFAPQVGVDEDPVTGSAHCCLAPFWAERLGRDVLVGYQASKRGGFVRVRVDADRVFLTGNAVTVSRGERLV